MIELVRSKLVFGLVFIREWENRRGWAQLWDYFPSPSPPPCTSSSSPPAEHEAAPSPRPRPTTRQPSGWKSEEVCPSSTCSLHACTAADIGCSCSSARPWSSWSWRPRASYRRRGSLARTQPLCWGRGAVGSETRDPPRRESGWYTAVRDVRWRHSVSIFMMGLLRAASTLFLSPRRPPDF